MTTTRKRQRSENWLEEDKILLKELVRERVSAIENKNTDTNSNSSKVAAWNDLRESFNNLRNGAERTVHQLKSQWSLLKISEKKIKATERKELHKTGGGPPVVIDVVNSEDISSWLPNEFTVDSNEFDSDQINQITILPPAAFAATSENFKEKIRTISPGTTLPDHSEQMITESESPALPGPAEEKIMVGHSTSSPATTLPGHSKEKIQSKAAFISRKKKIRGKSSPGEEIAVNELKCRRELHELQMENERHRGEYLKLKKKVMEEKLKYYKNKNMMM